MTLATFGHVAIACSLALIAALVIATLAARRADARREDAAMPEDDWPEIEHNTNSLRPEMDWSPERPHTADWLDAQIGIDAATENREDRG